MSLILSPLKVGAQNLNSPILVNEYSLPPYGVIWSQFEADHQFDLMEIWRLCRKPVKMHPLRWARTARAIEVVERLEKEFPPPSESYEGLPIEAYPGYDTSEVLEIAEQFYIDSNFDDGRWNDEYTSLFANAFVAHHYIMRINKNYKHTLIPCDPHNPLHYRGYTMRATRVSSKTPHKPRLYDVAGLAGLRFRGQDDVPIIKAIRHHRRRSQGRTVLYWDLLSHGDHILRKIYDTGDLPTDLNNKDLLLSVGYTRSVHPESILGFDPEILDEVFTKMKPIRDSIYVTRNGKNPYILVTAEMARYFVDELLQDGLLMLKGY